MVYPRRSIQAGGGSWAGRGGFVVVVLALFGYPGFEANSGFATIAVLISFLLGLIIVMLGIIGEYVWRIFDEVNHRPEAVIDEIY